MAATGGQYSVARHDLTDPDGSISGITWQWYRAKNSNPDLDPDIDAGWTAASDWEDDFRCDPNQDTYTPQGQTAALMKAHRQPGLRQTKAGSCW